MSEHTPGPWSVHHHYHINDEQWLSVLQGAWDITHNYAQHEGVIADSKYSAMSDEENLANARLIAAAPDLLEALEGLLEMTGNNHVWHGRNEKARAAIAKARGEEPTDGRD